MNDVDGNLGRRFLIDLQVSGIGVTGAHAPARITVHRSMRTRTRVVDLVLVRQEVAGAGGHVVG